MSLENEDESFGFSLRLIIILKSFFAPSSKFWELRWILLGLDWPGASETNGEETEKFGAAGLMVAIGLNGERTANGQQAV